MRLIAGDEYLPCLAGNIVMTIIQDRRIDQLQEQLSVFKSRHHLTEKKFQNEVQNSNLVMWDLRRKHQEQVI